MSHPKIELVRLSSTEYRSLPPLNFVQLCVRYTHRRMESYAGLVGRGPALATAVAASTAPVEPRCPKCVKRRRSCSHLTDAARPSVWGRFRPRPAVKSLENVAGDGPRSVSSTKSCENMLQVRRQPLAGEGRRSSPLAWREATRSEEHLAGGAPPTAPRDLRAAKSQEYFRKYTIDGSGELVPLGLGSGSQSVPGSPRGLWGKSNTMPNMNSADEPPPGKPRRTLSSFLKRLHPRLLRASLGGSRSAERRPWIVVEFQDVDGDGDRVSVGSAERETFGSAQKISLVKSRQSSREQLAGDSMLDSMRRGRVTACRGDEPTPSQQQPRGESGVRHTGDPAARVTASDPESPAPPQPAPLSPPQPQRAPLSPPQPQQAPLPPQQPPPNGTMFSEKELARGPQLASTRIIMDAQKELRTNGCGQDQLDRAAVTNVSQLLMQETHTLKTAIKSSEMVKQAVHVLSKDEHTPQKRPSYVGISCSVSGYSHLSRYGALSKSRDSSPARGLRSLSRDSSPPGGAGDGPADSATVTSPSRVSLIKQQLRDGGRLTDERGRDGQRPIHRAEQNRSVSVDRGYLRRYHAECARILNGDASPPVNGSASPPVNGSGSPPVNGSASPPVNGSVRASRFDSQRSSPAAAPERTAEAQIGEPMHAGNDAGDANVVSRSFVQARIERLYGPGALCSGFRRNLNLNRSLPNRTAAAGDQSPAAASRRPAPLQLSVDTGAADPAAPPSSPGLPVFRHLRPEFRLQLAVKPGRGRGERPPPPADTSPTQTAVPPITAADPPIISDVPPASRGSSVEPAPQLDGEEEAGYRFIKLIDAETTRILAMATKAENDLNARTLSPEIEGKVRAAKGKANLLIAQKFQQFRGLCEKNIKAPAGEPFPTTEDDLQGFWDMVLIQVHHIDAIMEELDAIRANNWQLPEVTPPREVSLSASSTPNSKSSISSRRSTPSDPAKAEAARARSAARKKMMEQRRRLMEEKRQAFKENGGAGDVEIFVADDK